MPRRRTLTFRGERQRRRRRYAKINSGIEQNEDVILKDLYINTHRLEMEKQKVVDFSNKKEIDRRKEMKRLSMKRLRERLKYDNPEKYEEIKKRNREYQKTRKKIDEMTELEKKSVRKKWRERAKIHRDKKKEVKQAPSSAPILQDVTSIYPVPIIKTEILDPSEKHDEFILPDSIPHATAIDPTLVVKNEIQDSSITNQFILPIIKEEPIEFDNILDVSKTEDLYESIINSEIKNSLFFKHKLTKCSVLLHDCLIPENLASISAQFIFLRINTDIPKSVPQLDLFPLNDTPFIPHISEAYKEMSFNRCKSCSYRKKRSKQKNKVPLNNFKKKRGPYKVKTERHICSCFKASEDAMLSDYENFSISTQQLCSCLTNDYMLTESTDMLMKEIAVFNPEFGKISGSINKVS